MYGNDRYGCCTKAGQAHLIGFFTGIANPPATVFTDQQVVDDYLRLTGGQDTGLDEVTVLEDWRDNKTAQNWASSTTSTGSPRSRRVQRQLASSSRSTHFRMRTLA